MACAYVGARRAWDDEPAGVSDGVAVRPSRRTEGCSDEACCSFPAGPVAALAAGNGERRGHPPTVAVWATRAARAARCSARARGVSAMDTTEDRMRNSGRKIPLYPYLARQMSDVGFRQTLKIRTLRCAQRSSPYRLAPRRIAMI